MAKHRLLFNDHAQPFPFVLWLDLMMPPQKLNLDIASKTVHIALLDLRPAAFLITGQLSQFYHWPLQLQRCNAAEWAMWLVESCKCSQIPRTPSSGGHLCVRTCNVQSLLTLPWWSVQNVNFFHLLGGLLRINNIDAFYLVVLPFLTP